MTENRMFLVKKILGMTGALTLAGLVVVAPVYALNEPTVPTADSQESRITQLRADVHIAKDGDIRITQSATVVADQEFAGLSQTFEPASIPRVPDAMAIRDVSAQINDQPASTEILQSGRKTTLTTTATKALPAGEHTVVVKYTLRDAFLKTKEGNQFLWDLTGVNWNIPIDEVSVNYTKDDELTIRFARFYFNDGIYSPPEITEDNEGDPDAGLATFDFVDDPLTSGFVTGADVKGLDSDTIRSGDHDTKPIITFDDKDNPLESVDDNQFSGFLEEIGLGGIPPGIIIFIMGFLALVIIVGLFDA
jgi:Predicted membrane protein (DUF2207)